MQQPMLDTIQQLPEYQQLVKNRSRLAWTLSAIMCSAYFGFILLVAFQPAFFEQIVWGDTITIGFPLGIGLILLAFILTGIYVYAANRQFDALTQRIREQVQA
ncbi:DUF485 domain-containing protein [Methylobacillus flagellatus]|uniref:DUF485 domain-containing protein n=1 Tax=Methylobacillus flagellatus TaxID=405 RepID=UPI0010F86D76|nr:DUF485 domain-containing protein [Methylobacillus flagellatus]